MNEHQRDQEQQYYPHEGGIVLIEPPELYRTRQEFQQTSKVTVTLDRASIETRMQVE